MTRIAILGTGNVAGHLAVAFSSAEQVRLTQIIGRNPSSLKAMMERLPTELGTATKTSDFSNIADADVYLLAVSDDSIAEVSGFLKDKKGLVAHTSGSVSMDVLSQHRNHGVFYPLQTFSKNREVDMESVPFCLEAGSNSDLEVLRNLASMVSEKVYEVDSDQRKLLHLAAVFTGNFTNHLYHIGQELCQKKGLSFDLLRPLIRETADKIMELSPYDAQTGPARRGDVETMEKHLEQLGISEHMEHVESLQQLESSERLESSEQLESSERLESPEQLESSEQSESAEQLPQGSGLKASGVKYDGEYKKVYRVLSESILTLYRDEN